MEGWKSAWVLETNIMDRLERERGMGLIFISHDLNLVATFCDRILIMYAGRIVETCAAKRLHEARHPYTQGSSMPCHGSTSRNMRCRR